ncbi:MAG: hypothetical protein GWN07_07855, partial [Actinobacteria bacterium]|nr:hypothetical protein [Actinomycetota bacterium]NIV86393.1 hypothetical protein [Actinomycetota bacterium]NIW27202.1 hypothetical protein [Actinomycetota bacterium]NIX19742.1 hypothetical protein [Actinomycetota bacterium]
MRADLQQRRVAALGHLDHVREDQPRFALGAGVEDQRHIEAAVAVRVDHAHFDPPRIESQVVGLARHHWQNG